MRHKEKSQRADTSVLPAVRRALVKLGGDIQLARRRRRVRQQSFADSLGISRATLHRLEAGDPGVSIGVLCRACLVLGHIEALRTLIELPERDATLLADEPPERIRRAKLEPSFARGGSPRASVQAEKVLPKPERDAGFDQGFY